MQTEFHVLQLTRQEALECLRAQVHLALLEEEVRLQKGLEPPELPPLINRLMDMLQLTDIELDDITDDAAEELWEYSWYAFTSEWAWFRAKQEAGKLLAKSKMKKASTETEQQKTAESLYKKYFDSYVNELNMRHTSAGNSSAPSSDRRTLRS